MRKKNKGYSLVLVVVISAVFIILIAALGTSVVSEAKMAATQEKRTQAYYIARSGAAATVKWITSMSPSNASNLATNLPLTSNGNAFGNGSYDIEIKEVGDELHIKSTGKVQHNSGYITDSVTSVLKVDMSLPAINNAIYAKDKISIQTDKIDGIPNLIGDVATASSSAGAVKFVTGANIQLNVKIPTGADRNVVVQKPDELDDIHVHNSEEIPTYPMPIFPSFPETLTKVTDTIQLWSEQHKTINAGFDYSTVVVGGGTLTIKIQNEENIIRIRDLTVMNGGKIIIDGNGTLKAYIDKCIEIANGTINVEEKKDKLIIYHGGPSSTGFSINNQSKIYGSLFVKESTFTITGQSTVTGDIISCGNTINFDGDSFGPQVIYAPNAKVTMQGSAKMEGAIIGKEVVFDNGGRIHLPEGGVELKIPIDFNMDSVRRYLFTHWK